MTTFERIKQLAIGKNKSLKQVATELGLGEHVLYKWKTSKPSIEELQKVADYFGVSTDFLLEQTNSLEPNAQQLGDDIATHFRLNTAHMAIEDVEQLEAELKEYFDFILERARQNKERQNHN